MAYTRNTSVEPLSKILKCKASLRMSQVMYHLANEIIYLDQKFQNSHRT